MDGNSNRFNAFIIGAQKAASSSLHFLLIGHPEVCSERDELSVFEDPFYSEGNVAEVLERHRRIKSNADIYLLKRPNLLCVRTAPDRIFDHNADAKLICILREPASRAVSAIVHYMKSGLLPVMSMDEALNYVFFAELRDPPEIVKMVREYGM